MPEDSLHVGTRMIFTAFRQRRQLTREQCSSLLVATRLHLSLLAETKTNRTEGSMSWKLFRPCLAFHFSSKYKHCNTNTTLFVFIRRLYQILGDMSSHKYLPKILSFHWPCHKPHLHLKRALPYFPAQFSNFEWKLFSLEWLQAFPWSSLPKVKELYLKDPFELKKLVGIVYLSMPSWHG